MEPLAAIRRIAERIAPGRSPSFMEAHVLKALEALSSEPRVGRKRLGMFLGLSEGVTRTLLRHLRAEGFIEVTRRGIGLTEKGARLLGTLRSHILGGMEVPSGPLTIGPKNFAVLVKGAGGQVRSGVEQRDAALKAGAMGATTLVFDGERFTIPGMEEAPPGVEEVYELLLRLKPRRGDVIIVGSASDILSAELGAKTAALELLRSMSREVEG